MVLGAASFCMAQSAAFITPNQITLPSTKTYALNQTFTSSESISAYFEGEHAYLSDPTYNLKEKSVKTSLTGTHYVFTAWKNGYEVFGAELRVHTNAEGKAFIVQDGIPEVFAIATPQNTMTKHFWVNYNGQHVLAEKRKLSDGNVALWYNNNSIYPINTKHFNQLPDTQVAAQVFLINPLNTAQKEYGSPYIDSNDLDVPVLNAERKWVNMNVRYENDTFKLISDRYWFAQISDPVTQPTYSLTDTFSFTRRQYQFEDVNAFYHITTISDYIEDRGFASMLPDTLVIDAHGYNGGDFSSFNYGVSPLELEFGEGGVDDAEDGETVVHEFTHALSHIAGVNSYSSTRDRAAMEEGSADYFSASYSKVYTDYAWKLMFNWDGHNPFFEGIHIGAELKYPQDMKNNTNADREMWSTPLMCIYDKIGRNAMDSLFLEHLYYQFKSASIPEMANVILKMDSMMFDSKYHNDIRNCFAKHSILASTGQSPVFTQLFNAFNTAGFSSSASPAEITAKNQESFNYLIYNNLGQKMDEGTSVNQLILNPEDYISGIYFVELKIGNTSTYLKILKN